VVPILGVQEVVIPPAIALRFGRLCGNGPAVSVDMRTAYDLDESEKDLGRALDVIPTLEAAESIPAAGTAIPRRG
jgi:plasmid maintenance system antidote protein VapI